MHLKYHKGCHHSYCNGRDSLDEAQTQIGNYAATLFNYEVRPRFFAIKRKEHNVLAVVVPTAQAGHRPCHLKAIGPFGGAFIRVGNATRAMTLEESRRAIVEDCLAQGHPAFDIQPFPAQLAPSVFSDALVTAHIEAVKHRKPESTIGKRDRLDALRGLGAVAETPSGLMATAAGMLFFCENPQLYMPAARIDVTQYWGADPADQGPDGSLYRDVRTIAGPVPEMIEEAARLIYSRIQIRGVLNGFKRRDVAEYPDFAFREAIVNAVAHRDYTLAGSKIHLRLFPDRIEVQSPGGLPAPVTVDNIEQEQATRNPGLVRLLQDRGYMEERGFGIDEMIRTLRGAGLPPPQFVDKGSSFTLTLRSHVLMTPETLRWLGRFTRYPLTEHHRLALAYLKLNQRLANRDYARLTGRSSVESRHELREMVDMGLLRMHSTRGGAFYTLTEEVPDATPLLLDLGRDESDEDIILNLVRRRRSISKREVMVSTGWDNMRARSVLKRLRQRGELAVVGATKGARYVPATGDPGSPARAEPKSTVQKQSK